VASRAVLSSTESVSSFLFSFQRHRLLSVCDIGSSGTPLPTHPGAHPCTTLPSVSEKWQELALLNFHVFRMATSGMLHRVALVRTGVSEELSASFIRVTSIGELGTTLATTSNRRTLRRGTNWVFISQKTTYFIVEGTSRVSSYTEWTQHPICK
jgi:hypothetical protein